MRRICHLTQVKTGVIISFLLLSFLASLLFSFLLYPTSIHLKPHWPPFQNISRIQILLLTSTSSTQRDPNKTQIWSHHSSAQNFLKNFSFNWRKAEILTIAYTPLSSAPYLSLTLSTGHTHHLSSPSHIWLFVFLQHTSHTPSPLFPWSAALLQQLSPRLAHSCPSATCLIVTFWLRPPWTPCLKV